MQNDPNEKASLHLRVQRSDLNQARIDNIIERLSYEMGIDNIKWILEDPLIDFSQNVVDDVINKNVQFYAKAGLQPMIMTNNRPTYFKDMRTVGVQWDLT